LLLCAALAVTTLLHIRTLWNERENIAAAHGDFIIYYTGAQIFLDGKGESLYDLKVQKDYQEPFDLPFRPDPLPYNHPPYELLLFAPLALLTYPYAFLIWAFINLILLLAMIWILSPLVKAENRILSALIWGAFFPVTAALWQGQDSILSAFLLSAVIMNLKHGRGHLAGMMLALGLYKPQLVLPVALVLSARRCWTALVAFTVTGSLLVLISMAMIGWAGATQYFGLLRWINTAHYSIDPARMVNLRGLFENLITLDLPHWLVVLITLLSSAGMLYWSLSLWRSNDALDGPASDLRIAHLIVVTILVSYHLYVHDLTLLAIPLIILFNRAAGGDNDVRRVMVTPLSALLVFSMPVVELLLPRRLMSWTAIGLVFLAFVVARELRRTKSLDENVARSGQSLATPF
jgi:glycosyl transferase family 87